MTLASQQGLFVIGAARSGTTILQNALNHATEIFMLGEPNLHEDDGSPGFAERFNSMHRAWGNQSTKSTRLPLLLGEDGTWSDHLGRLGQSHRWVGSKVVTGSGYMSPWIGRLDSFNARHFYKARFIFVFRHPMALVVSTRRFQEGTGNAPHTAHAILANYAATLALFTRMLRTFPHVRGLVHEDICAATFEELGTWLGVDLSGAHAYYRPTHHEVDAAEIVADEPVITQMNLLYTDLRTLLSAPLVQPQIEQNDNYSTDDHYTALGSIDRRARFIRDYLNGPDDVAVD